MKQAFTAVRWVLHRIAIEEEKSAFEIEKKSALVLSVRNRAFQIRREQFDSRSLNPPTVSLSGSILCIVQVVC